MFIIFVTYIYYFIPLPCLLLLGGGSAPRELRQHLKCGGWTESERNKETTEEGRGQRKLKTAKKERKGEKRGGRGKGEKEKRQGRTHTPKQPQTTTEAPPAPQHPKTPHPNPKHRQTHTKQHHTQHAHTKHQTPNTLWIVDLPTCIFFTS